MKNYLKRKIQLELIWWLLTAVITLLLLLPLFIYDIEFPYFYYNIFFILAAITLTRLIFQLKHSFLSRQLVLKLFLMFASVAIFMLAYRGMSLYNIFTDQKGFYYLYEHLALETRYDVAAYINAQYYFFGVATAAAAVLMPFRLLVSIFRVKNYGEE